MSFSITSALVLLMTLGQIFLEGGEFKSYFAPHEKPQALELLRKSCRMVLEDEDIRALSPDALMMVLKQGISRQEAKVKEQVENQCAKQNLEFIKLNGPDIEPPKCNKAEALAEIQKSLPKLVSPISEPLQIFKDFDMKDAVALYDYICSPEPSQEAPLKVSMDEVLHLYNKAMGEALQVDLNQFHHPTLPQSSLIYSYDGKEVIGEVFNKEGRRTWVPLSQIPPVVVNAFVSAEDKNFFQHKGVELRGVLRGFIRYIKDKTIVGGSTLTQQVVKNLVLSSDITLERKIKEMVISSRLEKTLSKNQILEIYLNLINLGRHSWGIQTATTNYFGEDRFVSDLGLNEASFLAGVTHAPNSYEPELNFEKIKDRQQFVLKEMKENGYISEDELQAVQPEKLRFVERSVLQSSYFHRSVEEDIKKRLSKADAEQGGLFLFSTQVPAIQKAMEKGLQEQLYKYENNNGRLTWKGPLGNLLTKPAEKLTTFELGEFHDPRFWGEKIKRFKTLYQDVHWNLAVVLDRTGKDILIGTLDDKDKPVIANLSRNYDSRWAREAIKKITLGDVVFVEAQKKSWALRTQPKVQSAAIAMEAKTGKVLAVTGGFSFHDSELNRALHSFRQPGSTVKPFTYLAALNQGIQPNQIFSSGAIQFAPIYLPGAKKLRRNMKCNSWYVRNYSSSGPGSMTMRRGLETSNNRVTAHVLKSIWPSDPEIGLGLVRDIFMDFGIYKEPQDCYPVILGSDETNLVQMAAAYAAIANGGTLVDPHFLDVKRNAGLLHTEPRSRHIFSVDPISLYQTKNILSGVVTRGTGFALREYSGLVGGKTGTSTSYNDAWFMGFSNDIVVGVWVGYDNGQENGKKNTLGSGGTGGSIAAPIAKAVFDEAFKLYPPQKLINNPPQGVKLYNLDGVIEAFRGEYSNGSYAVEVGSYSEEPNDEDWFDSGFYDETDPNEDPEESLSPDADRAIREGTGGLY